MKKPRPVVMSAARALRSNQLVAVAGGGTAKAGDIKANVISEPAGLDNR